MNIQPNILIWTILCFCAFMLILWRLLLRPLLRFMDAREARIAHARTLDKSAQLAEEEARREAERQLALRRRAEDRQRELLALRETGEAEEYGEQLRNDPVDQDNQSEKRTGDIDTHSLSCGVHAATFWE